jgi:hypothetical protein
MFALRFHPTVAVNIVPHTTGWIGNDGTANDLLQRMDLFYLL